MGIVEHIILRKLAKAISYVYNGLRRREEGLDGFLKLNNALTINIMYM